MICRKCNSPGTLIIRKEYCYCDECFIFMINHKFRACLGKNKTLSANEKILICLSGDACSTVLLDLVYNAISLNNHKKLRVVPYVLYIIETVADNEKISNSIIEQCKSYGFPLTITNINEYNKNFFSNKEETESQNSYNSKSILSNVTSSIHRDVMMKIKQNIFLKISKELDCNTVFTAETTTSLATKLLSNIVIGRGSQIENDIGFADKRDRDTRILRPLRDITNEEIEHYIQIKEIKPAKAMHNKLNETSLQSVIKNFVMDLQENYPATISTICKTADKIGSITNNINKKKCVVCQSNLDNNDLNLTAVDATVFSRKVSLRQSGESKYNEDSQNIEENNLMFPFIYQSLCYCCSRNMSELGNNKIKQ
ncbi:unnamed protein product [Euphydryas editha]|uniref:Cytoplasmic tRNA 2-thiolation protein 2 n=1 Tax=Euphydryas editha TaxID=104508 RepID=A0AAU9UX83_EUPED|nr:unnamed protein product [Euphydryas editha]